MRRALLANRAFRIIFWPLLAAGIVVHLWISARVGLVMVAVGLAAHVLAAVAGRRWLAQRRQARRPVSSGRWSRRYP
jgi:type IV secretory pathway TrbD component